MSFRESSPFPCRNVQAGLAARYDQDLLDLLGAIRSGDLKGAAAAYSSVAVRDNGLAGWTADPFGRMMCQVGAALASGDIVSARARLGQGGAGRGSRLAADLR